MIKILYFIILLFTFSLDAREIVCAGINMHYSYQFTDFGTRPPVGTYAGRKLFVINGIKKGEQKFWIERPNTGKWDFELDFQNKRELIKEDHQAYGFSVFEVDLVFKSSDSSVSEKAICKETWALVP